MRKIFLLLFLIPLISYSQSNRTALNIEADSLLTNTARQNNAKYFNRILKNIVLSDFNVTAGDILPKANGGTGTSTPSLVAGTNISITGTWPNQTINSAAGGGLSLTTTGSSGAATLVGSTLNIPNYTPSTFNGFFYYSLGSGGGSTFNTTMGSVSDNVDVIGSARFNGSNDGPATLSVNSLTALPLTKNGLPLQIGDVMPNRNYVIINRSPTIFEMIGETHNNEYDDFISRTSGKTRRPTAKAATTTTLPSSSYSSGVITASSTGTFGTIDGISIDQGEYLLIKDESSSARNGVYKLTDSGGVFGHWQLTRRTDQDTGAELTACLIYVEQGSTNGRKFFYQTNTVTTVGTDPVAYTQY